MQTERAECYCGNIQAEVLLSKPLTEIVPRACDCDFCVKHGAEYVSDATGAMAIRIRNPDKIALFAQGSRAAEFLICGECGVLFGGTLSIDGSLRGTLNARTLVNRSLLQAAQTASPKRLSRSEKVDRWSQIWFRRVTIERGAGEC